MVALNQGNKSFADFDDQLHVIITHLDQVTDFKSDTIQSLKVADMTMYSVMLKAAIHWNSTHNSGWYFINPFQDKISVVVLIN